MNIFTVRVRRQPRRPFSGKEPRVAGHRRSTIPWKFSVFLLAVFALVQPFDIANSSRIANHPGLSVDETVYAIESGSFGRPVGMLFLLTFATATLTRHKSDGSRLGIVAWAAAAYIAIAILSITRAEDTILVLKRIAILVAMSAAAFAWAYRARIRTMARAAVVVCGATLGLSVGTELLLGTLHPLDPQWRFAGVLNPVMQGWNCGMLLIGSVFLSDTEKQWRVWLRTAAAFALVFLVLSRSRVPFMSAIIATTLYYLIRWRKYKRLLQMTLLVTVMGCITYIIYEPPDSFVAALASFGRGEEGLASVDSLNGRIPLWEVCLHYVGQRPILGYGYNGFFNPKRIDELSSPEWVPMHPHSGYLDTLLGVGLVGASAFSLTLLLSVREIAIRMRSDSHYVFALVVCVWFCFNLATESISSTAAFPTFVWMALIAQTALVPRGFVVAPDMQRMVHLSASSEKTCRAVASR